MKSLALLVLLCACAPRPVEGWGGGDVPYQLSEKMSPECEAAALDALDFWRDHGVDYLVQYHVSPEQAAQKTLGAITVSQGDVPDTSDEWWNVGLCSLRARGREIRAAHITLELCDLVVAAHELGHSLGLEHVNDPKNVMYPWHGGLEVTDEQLDAVVR